MIVAGVFALASPTFLASTSSMERIIAVGLGAILIGLFITFSYSGTLIDFPQNRFNEYTSFGGYKSGEWESLPAIVKVKAVQKSYISTNTPNGVSPTLSGKVTDYIVLLYADAAKPLFSFEYSKKAKAEKEARQLASQLKAELEISFAS